MHVPQGLSLHCVALRAADAQRAICKHSFNGAGLHSVY